MVTVVSVMLVSVTDCRHGAGASMMKRIPPRMLPLLVTSQDFSFFLQDPSFFWRFSETLNPENVPRLPLGMVGWLDTPKKMFDKFPESPNRCSGTYHRDDAIIKTIVISIRTTDGFRTLLRDFQKKNKIQITMDKNSSNNDLTFVVSLLLTRKCVKHWALTSCPEKQREHWRLRSRHCHKHNRLVLHPNHLLHSPGEFSPSQTCSLCFLWFCDIMSCAFFTKLATKADPWSSSPLATFKHNKDQQHRSLTNPTWPNTQSARSAKLPQSLFQPLA